MPRTRIGVDGGRDDIMVSACRVMPNAMHTCTDVGHRTARNIAGLGKWGKSKKPNLDTPPRFCYCKAVFDLTQER